MTALDRRKVLKTLGLAGTAAAAGSSLAAPAIAQSAPELRWRLTSSFPKNLDTIYGAAEVFTKALAEATDQKFQVQVFPAGELVGGLKAADEVTKGTVEMCHTASYYYWGKDPSFAFGTAVPFGLNARMQLAWLEAGGGGALLDKFYARYKLVHLPGGNTGAQMGGWYRKEIKKAEDFRGLKIRIGGFGGSILAKLGAVPQQISGGDIYQALQKNTIDAAEWVGPYDDEKLGFQDIAKYYYYPGWWEGGALLNFFINQDKWEKLPTRYKAAMRGAASLANTTMQARYDVLNPPALKRLVAGGAALRRFPEDVLEACFNAAVDVYDETSARNPTFKELYNSMRAYRADAYLWEQIAENGYNTFMMIQERKRRL